MRADVRAELRAPVTEEDWLAYHAIRRHVLFELRGSTAYNPAHPDEHRPGNYPFLLWDGDVAIGVIRVDIDGTRAIFRRVAIREDRQRCGYGRRLLETAEQFARRQLCTHIESHVDSGAIVFYERCGFVRVSDNDDRKSTLLMTKQLD